MEKKEDLKENFKNFMVGLVILFIIIFSVKSCLTGDSNTSPDKNDFDKKITAYVMAQSFLEQRLTSPSTAKYPFGMSKDHTSYEGDGIYVINSYVDSHNIYGAMLRTNFTIKVKETSEEEWSLISLEIK